MIEQELAYKVVAYQESRGLGSLFVVEATGREGGDLEQLEQAVIDVLQRFLGQPPTPEELRRAQNGYAADFVSRLQALQRKAELLSLYEITTGEAGSINRDLMRYLQATPRSVQRFCKEVIDLDRRCVAQVIPR